MKVTEADLSQICQAHNQVPEMHSAASVQGYQSRIGQKPFLALLASTDSEVMGFKLGYALDKTHFYSWVGGVLPQFRGKGVANSLLHAQESWAMEKGYRCIKVKTMNCFPDMLKMLVSNHYKVCDFEHRKSLDDAKIHLCKFL